MPGVDEAVALAIAGLRSVLGGIESEGGGLVYWKYDGAEPLRNVRSVHGLRIEGSRGSELLDYFCGGGSRDDIFSQLQIWTKAQMEPGNVGSNYRRYSADRRQDGYERKKHRIHDHRKTSARKMPFMGVYRAVSAAVGDVTSPGDNPGRGPDAGVTQSTFQVDNAEWTSQTKTAWVDQA